MTDLQGALIVLGVLAVAAVAIYNYWQERQFRRKSGQAMPPSAVDPLLQDEAGIEDGAQGSPATEHAAVRLPAKGADSRREPSLGDLAAGDGRIEPAFDVGTGDRSEAPAGTPSEPEPEVERSGSTAPRAPGRRPEPATGLEGPPGLWYPMVFRLPAIADDAALAVIRSEVSGESRLSDWLDPDLLGEGGDDADEQPTIDRILRIQAVDPRGPASVAELQGFLANAHRAAGSVGGLATAPDPAATAAQAAALHEFCSSVDVAIGLNVAATSGGFSGTKLRGLIEAAGFRALPDHTYVLSDEAGTTLCTLTDGSGGGLDPQALRSQAVRAISLLLDVPRTPGTIAQFERMVTQTRQFAQALSGNVVDDSGRVLDEPSIGRIRAQLASMLKAMRARGIEPGDAIARRIFG